MSRTKSPSSVAAMRRAAAHEAPQVGGQQRLAFLVPRTGTYYIEVKFLPPAQGRITYTLAVATRP